MMLLWYLLGWFIICKADRCFNSMNFREVRQAEFRLVVVSKIWRNDSQFDLRILFTVWVEKPQASN